MKLAKHYQLMSQYNQWMNQKLYALCAEIPDDVRKKDLGAFFKSIHSTLNHLLYADQIWMDRFRHDGKITLNLMLGVDIYDDFTELTEARKKTDHDILKWVDTLDEQWLQSDFSITSQAYKRTFTMPAWCFVDQLFNHQTHHRGQVTTLLTQLGYDIGGTDIPLMPGLYQQK